MKPTKITNLISLLAIVGITGFFVIQQFVGAGLPAPAVGLNLVIILPSVAVILVLSSIPMIRYRSGLKKFEEGKGKRPTPVDSAYAIRTLALSKAVSIAGSIFAGWSLAVLTHQLISPEPRPLLTILGLVGSLVLTTAGLIVENLFRIPPDRDGDAA